MKPSLELKVPQSLRFKLNEVKGAENQLITRETYLQLPSNRFRPAIQRTKKKVQYFFTLAREIEKERERKKSQCHLNHFQLSTKLFINLQKKKKKKSIYPLIQQAC